MPVIGFVDLDRRFRDRTDAELEHSELEDAETFASLDGLGLGWGLAGAWLGLGWGLAGAWLGLGWGLARALAGRRSSNTLGSSFWRRRGPARHDDVKFELPRGSMRCGNA